MMFNIRLVTTSSMWNLEKKFGHIQIYAAFYVQAMTVPYINCSKLLEQFYFCYYWISN
jgi:hypothetical protein